MRRALARGRVFPVLERSKRWPSHLFARTPHVAAGARGTDCVVAGLSFRSDQLWTTLTTLFLPAVATIGIEGVANEMLSHLTPADPAAVRDKTTRYLTCFTYIYFVD